MSAIISLSSWPRAILHIDGDCFFASCEVAKNPALKGKPVVTGLERGIVSSLTYEAKALGIKRAMSLVEVKKLVPSVILVPSDYETYSLYSVRMYNIVRRYTSIVEEYSIDECFAELTGLRGPMHMSYEEMAVKIKHDLDTELGITFSLGLAPTKVLAKIASKWAKPSGLTVISGRDIEYYIKDLPVSKVWGIGPQTTAYMNTLGIRTTGQFMTKDKDWVVANFSKPHQEIWQELRGQSVYDLVTTPHNAYQSISKTKTFTPPSCDREFVFSQLSKNIENAFIKVRRHQLATKKIFIFIKTQDFRYRGIELKLSQHTDMPLELIPLVRIAYQQIFVADKLYRATGVVLIDLTENKNNQLDLFTSVIHVEKMSRVFQSFDELADKYGKHVLFIGSSFKAITGRQYQGERGVATERKNNILKGETKRRRIGLPMLGSVV
ncbi:MAG: DNA polymerase IV [Parcubacteria group bacterium]|nr:MAG: DNA polymerase IV [Parcubacteria group bacterium]